MTLETGSTAPNFTLKSKTDDGLKDVTLSDQLGNPCGASVFPLCIY